MTPGRPDFFTAVYAVVARIPAGQVATYGLVAFLAGRPRASRIVGCALARAPEGLPCHRVLYRDGGLSPADVFGGTGIQRLLLEGEGVPFLGGPVPLPVGRRRRKEHPMNVTFEMVRSSPEIRTYITQADASLTALGFTEHSFAHVTKCAEVAARILTQLGYTPKEV